ncbi:MAG: MFS transporter [Patescibacteria group bacterium]
MLPEKSRILIFSFALRSIAHPLLTIFINSFIWRSTASLPSVVIYNLGFFIFLPLGFYVNGLLLKRIKITKLYFTGLVVTSIAIAATILFSGSTVWHFLFYGGIYGFGAGIYWANRNFLTFQEIESSHRNYFYSIASILNSLISLLVTFLVGWLIVLGENSGLYTPTIAYWVLSVLAVVVMTYSGVIILKTDYVTPKINTIAKFRISTKWNMVRLISFSMGVLEGVGFFLPTLLILFYLGDEGVLGTISTIVTLIIATATYLYGRLSKSHHRKPVFFVSLSLNILFSIFLLLLDHPFNIYVYVLFAGIASIFQWLTIEPILLDVMDDETNEEMDNQYMFVFDKELFLNIGRFFSVSVLLLIIKFTSQKTGLMVSPLILGVSQLILMSYILRKSKF